MQFAELAKQFSVKNLPESEVELAGEVPYEVIAPYREYALKHIAEHMELPGFRPGKVPPEIALSKVGEVAVLEEAAEHFVKEFYPELVAVHKLEAVGRPDIRLTKLAPQNPAGFVVRTCVYPEVEVPKGWKELNKDIPLEPYTGDLPKVEPPPSEKDQKQAREMLARNIRRGKLIEKLVASTTVAVPCVFVESELEKILAQIQEDVERMGMKFDEYLTRVQKTKDTLRSEFRDQATRRAKLQLVLNKLAEEEKVEPDKESLENELGHALKHFPNAKPELVRIHIETVLRNEKVLKMLEGDLTGEKAGI